MDAPLNPKDYSELMSQIIFSLLFAPVRTWGIMKNSWLRCSRVERARRARGEPVCFFGTHDGLRDDTGNACRTRVLEDVTNAGLAAFYRSVSDN